MAQEAQKSVTVLPFSTPAEKDFSHLQGGLAAILASRLAAHAGLSVVNPGPLMQDLRQAWLQGDHQGVRDKVKAIGVDYVVIGNLLPVADQLQVTTTVLVDMTKANSFTITANREEELLVAMDDLSWDISEQLFGKRRPGTTAAQSSTQTDTEDRFATPHPDRTYRETLLTGTTDAVSDEQMVSSARRSRSIPLELRAMDVADLDGDGMDEIVLASGQELVIYRFSGEHFARKATIPVAGYTRILAVNIADIDNNGQAEIYVSTSKGIQAFSWVFSWNGKNSTVLAKNIPYYLRPVQVAGGKTVLMGQKSDLEGPVAPTIYRLALQADGNVQQLGTVPLPQGINLFSFSYGDINGDGSLETVAINNDDQLLVFDTSGRPLWKAGGYGASKIYYGPPPSETGYDKARKTIPQRIAIHDIDLDGRQDVIVAKNIKTTVAYLQSLTSFEGGSIEALTWKNNGLHPLWATRNLPGYVAGLQVTSLQDQENNKTTRLYFGESTSEGLLNFFSGKSCQIHAYTIDSTEK
jgi:TolB-like protein